jgi:hypothetical protein
VPAIIDILPPAPSADLPEMTEIDPPKESDEEPE